MTGTTKGERDLYLPLIVLMEALFHETILLLIPISALYWIIRRELDVRRVVALGIALVAWSAVFSGVWAIVGPLPYEVGSFPSSRKLTDCPWTLVNTLVMISPLVLLNRELWAKLPQLTRSGLLLLPLMIIAIWTVARPDESRLFLPASPLIIPIVLMTLSNDSSDAWMFATGIHKASAVSGGRKKLLNPARGQRLSTLPGKEFESWVGHTEINGERRQGALFDSIMGKCGPDSYESIR